MNGYGNRSEEERKEYIKFMEDFGEFYSNKITCDIGLVPDFLLSIVMAMLSDANVTSEEFDDITENLNIKYKRIVSLE